MKTLNISILSVYLNFHKFPGSDFRVHWNALNLELGKTNSEIPTSEQSGTRHYTARTTDTGYVIHHVVYLFTIQLLKHWLQKPMQTQPNSNDADSCLYSVTVYLFAHVKNKWMKKTTWQTCKSQTNMCCVCKTGFKTLHLIIHIHFHSFCYCITLI